MNISKAAEIHLLDMLETTELFFLRVNIMVCKLSQKISPPKRGIEKSSDKIQHRSIIKNKNITGNSRNPQPDKKLLQKVYS